MSRHNHTWIETCDCQDHDAEEERDCCCVDGEVCWETPIFYCVCGKRRPA